MIDHLKLARQLLDGYQPTIAPQSDVQIPLWVLTALVEEIEIHRDELGENPGPSFREIKQGIK